MAPDQPKYKPPTMPRFPTVEELKSLYNITQPDAQFRENESLTQFQVRRLQGQLEEARKRMMALAQLLAKVIEDREKQDGESYYAWTETDVYNEDQAANSTPEDWPVVLIREVTADPLRRWRQSVRYRAKLKNSLAGLKEAYIQTQTPQKLNGERKFTFDEEKETE